MISKELLSEVVDFKNIDGREWSFKINGNRVVITYNIKKYFDGNIIEINLYELMFNLKEWAKSKRYTIISGYDNDYMGEKYNKKTFGYCCQIQDDKFKINDFYEDNEVKAVIKACELILNETNS